MKIRLCITMRTNEQVVLIGQRVVLAPYERHHVPRYHEWMSSPFLLAMTASEPLSIEEEYEMQHTWHIDNDKCTFIVYNKEAREKALAEGLDVDLAKVAGMCGDVNLFFNDQEDRAAAEVEIMIADESSRGRGLGREALLHMLRYGAVALGVKRYTAKISFENEPSLRLFGLLGFVEESRSDVFKEVTLRLDPVLPQMWASLSVVETTKDSYFQVSTQN